MVPSKWVRCCQGSTCTKRIKTGEKFVGNRYVASGTCIAVACSRNAPASYYLVQPFRQNVHASSSRSYILTAITTPPSLTSQHHFCRFLSSTLPPNPGARAAMLAGKAGTHHRCRIERAHANICHIILESPRSLHNRSEDINLSCAAKHILSSGCITLRRKDLVDKPSVLGACRSQEEDPQRGCLC